MRKIRWREIQKTLPMRRSRGGQGAVGACNGRKGAGETQGRRRTTPSRSKEVREERSSVKWTVGDPSRIQEANISDLKYRQDTLDKGMM